ncbi:hypothetical protein N7E02_00530 (plasmid) [Aliirhizobium terrae]|uniref:hypothetical protein n=1 Tax=Terrirhizobium terrae TaxID=2926709 RepID=UPI0025787F27|nr:hypothetical protein [Rhizobium sp. CC-CFT758]WJH37956.1 hypothetical protein N7E02_00530 [Rhizobium sp. CC-CFT758]
MRTPWRFLSDLVTRKPTAGHVDDLQNGAKSNEAENFPSTDELAKIEPDAVEIAREQDGAKADLIPSDNPASGQVVEAGIVRGDDGGDAVAPLVGAEDAADKRNREVGSANRPEIPLSGEATLNRADRAEVVGGEAPAPVTKIRKTKPQAVKAEQTTISFEDQNSGPASGSNTVFDEMAELDAEIAVLRKRLAEKLAVQNEQLRQMVKRFDRI